MNTSSIKLEFLHLETLGIEKLVYGGKGLARVSEGEGAGKIVFVPFSAPGDQCRVGILPKTKPVTGHIQEILTPGPYRVKPECSVFGVCGGCHWQHLEYAAQLRWKQAIVKESLTRIGKLPETLDVLPVIGSTGPGSWHYRNKVQWLVESSYSESESKNNRLGYHGAESHSLVEFEHCHIIPPAFTELAHWLQANFCDLHRLEKITVRMNRQDRWLVVFHTAGRDDLVIEADWIALFQAAFPQIESLIVMGDKQEEIAFGYSYLMETFGNHTFQVSWDSFFQINTPMAEQMLSYIRDWLTPLGQLESLIDLYAGVGTFAICLSDLALSVIAVEANPIAIEDAEKNFERNGVTHGGWLEGPVETMLEELPNPVTVTLLDPPRSGCHPQVLDWVADNTTQQIIYTSCDPTTLARDLKVLVEKGWQIKAVQPFDLFPQTYHIETLVQLTK